MRGDGRLRAETPHRGNPHTLRAVVGRGAELVRIDAYLKGDRAASLLVIEGPAGIGKTTLWRAGIERAQELGRTVLSARAPQVETGLAFAGLQTLLGEAVEEVMDALPAPQRLALDIVLLRAEPPAGGLNSRAVATALLSALSLLAAHTPVVVAVDDLQWLDGETVRALSFAVARLGENDVRVLATVRAAHGVSDLGLDRDRVERLAVGALEVGELRELVRERLGESLSLPAARQLTRVTGGNPLFALELVRVAGRRGLVGGPLRAADVEQLIGDQLAGLPPATRGALGLVAALAEPTVVRLASVLARVDVLDPAFAAGVLEQEGELLRFAHPLLGAGAYAAVPPARRREIHRRLAAASQEPDERARHLAAAGEGPDAATAGAIERGAEAAAARGAPAAAAELLEAAARLTPSGDPELAARRRLAAAQQLLSAGDSRRALELLEALVAELPPGDLRAQALITIAWPGIIDLDRAIALGKQAVGESATAGSRAGCLLLLANVVHTRDKAGALELAADALALATEGGAPRLRAWAMAVQGTWEVHIHPDHDGVGILRAALALEIESGTDAPDRYLSARTQLGLALMLRDELEEARALLEAERQAALAAGDELGASGPAFHLAELECRAGWLEAARRYAEEALTVLDEGLDAHRLGAVLYVRALVAALEGDAERARTFAWRSISMGEAIDDRTFPIQARAVLGMLELSLGNPAEALSHLEPLPARYRQLGYGEPGRAPFEPDRIEALIQLGRHGEAHEAVEAWERVGRQLGRPRVLATACRLRGLLSAGIGDTAQALLTLEAALGHHQNLPDRHEYARTLLAYGATLRRAGRRRDARAALDHARATFTTLGESIWADRAANEIQRLGGRTSAGQTLTATEQHVAELVAQGRSNREVAEALYITVRTVEANLTRIYAKLGVRSRTQLIAQRQSQAK